MSLPRFAVRRPVATIMFYVAVCVLGLFSWWALPVDLLPNSAAGSLSVYVGVRGGLPPEEIEDLVTKIVEEAVASVQHLRSVLSVSRKDRSVVTLTYEPGTDLGFAALEVQERLAKIKNKLPKDIEKPVVAHYSENDYPVIILSLTSDKHSPERLREMVDNSIKPELMRVNGVANVEVGGGRERKILVEFYQDRLEAYELSIRQVIDTIGKQNLNLLTGKREEGSSSISIRIGGTYKTMDDLQNLVVLRSKEGSSIRLKDIADVKDFYLEAQTYARLNKKPTVSVYVQKANDANTIRVAERVRKVAARLQTDVLGSDIKMDVITDQSVFVSEAMNNVVTNLTIGMLLTLLVIFLFLREWRHTLVVFLSAPIAVCITLTAMLVTGFTLNVMTLSALALGIGLVVNSAIVVLENVLDRKRRAFHHDVSVDNKEVTSQATEELYISLMGSTLTMVVVFLPIVFINQQVKILYSGLAFTITYAMVASLLVSVTLVPLLASRIGLPSYSGYFSPRVRGRLAFLLGRVRNATPLGFRRFLTRLGFSLRRVFPSSPPADLWGPPPEEVEPEQTVPLSSPPGFWGWVNYYWFSWAWPPLLTEIRFAQKSPRRAYIHWCGKSLRNQKWISLVIGVAAIASVLMYLFVLEKDFFGTTEQSEFIIYVELPAGAKLDVSDSIVREVERILSDNPDVAETVKTAAARVEGWSSKVYVTLRPRSERSRSVQEVISELRPKVADIGQQFDTFIYFSEPESSKEFFIDVFGINYDTLRDLASAIAERIQNVSGLADVKLRYKPGQPEVQVLVDKDRAAMFGLTLRDIAEDLHARIRGLRPSYFFTDSNQMEIIARDKEQFRKSLEDIHALTLMSPQGGNTPIQQFATFEFALTPSEVWRKDKQRVIQVSANREKLPLSTAAKKSLSALKGLQAPNGYYFQIGGDYVDMVQNEREFRFAFIVMAGLVFIVLASLFESYLQAILIMVTIPMALIGSIPLLYVTNTSATMSVYIGMIMLGGVAVSDAIVLVEKINQFRLEGWGLKRAVLESSWVRLSPILNTSLTTIVGLVPMVLSRSESAQLWAPLALTVIGGAAMATVLTLFMIPALYYHMETYKMKIQRFIKDEDI
ncbi:MAG: efflux RND transporter permease subunit [Elusimicrobia bacterium]|nr:efflux RND transporter permease subunit [Elusimicrobiota bacterium]